MIGVLFLWVVYLIGNSCWLVCCFDLSGYDWLLFIGVVIGVLVLLLVFIVFFVGMFVYLLV